MENLDAVTEHHAQVTLGIICKALNALSHGVCTVLHDASDRTSVAAAHGDLHRDLCIRSIVEGWIHCGSDAIILDRVVCWQRVKHNIPVDAIQPPSVLVLQKGAIAPLQDLYHKNVFCASRSMLESLGGIKFDRCATVLVIAEQMPVQPTIACTGHSVQNEPNLTLFLHKSQRQLETPSVDSERIRFQLWLSKWTSSKWIGHVCVDWCFIALDLPVRRH
mmetsp:Transcript_128394/g.411547  ORF Transcript_128394/g.411547 Transcript_128394/m.411547 type:complete len:219 (-) Transcript_128394:600-1256(-)